VARYDWPALMLTRLATAMFWFNPLTWALARETVQQAEEAADAHAARLVEPTRYAETLLSWGQIGRGIGVPANSIAPGARALSRRVRAVLEPRLLERSAGSRLAIVAILLCVGVAAPVGALELVEAARPDNPSEPPAPPIVAASLSQPSVPLHPAAPVPAEPADEDEAEAPEVGEVREVDLAPALESVREMLPRIPHEAAGAVRAIDPEALSRALHSAKMHRIPRHELDATLAHARASIPDEAALRAHLQRINPEELEARIRASMPSEAAIRAQVHNAMRARRHGMEQGAAGLERGAEGMERGAAKMEESARRFRDPAERERIIARERARGHIVTHEDLLEAAEGMEEGARGMREGARGMREGAREMRRDS
jgi:hypothetical protein